MRGQNNWDEETAHGAMDVVLLPLYRLLLIGGTCSTWAAIR